MIIQIPFSGFYESIHNQAFNDEIDYCFTDYATGLDNNEALSNRLYDSLDWSAAFNDYAKEYAANFAYLFGIEMQFESLSSPKYYNFTTDRIFCEISESEMQRLFDETDKAILSKVSSEMFTSRDGFFSSYNADWKTWGELSEFDHNQLHAVLMAWLETVRANEVGDYEFAIYETLSCNGNISELVYKHCTDKRIYRVFEYLQDRKAA